MKASLPSIPQLYRNVRRVTEVLSVLSKYGLAEWLSRINIDFIRDRLKTANGEILARQSLPARVRLALTELGPTFIKLGQLLSTRPDVVGLPLADELTKLQADVPADDFEKIKEIIEGDQNCELGEIFSYFEETPIASASIGQVHRAKLVDGSSVVVKVRHHGIERVVDTDLEILAGLAQLAAIVDEFKPYQPVQLAREMARTMKAELDFDRECRNIQQFRAMFRNDRTVLIPEPVTERCSSRVLTMRQLDGCKLSDRDQHDLNESQLEKLARRGANAYLKMIFEHGFYHADPHPGNILICEKALGLLDFGMVGRLSESMREDIESILMAIVTRDVPLLSAIIRRLGACPLELDEDSFSNDLADFVGRYSTQELSHFDMSGALTDFISIVRRYRITLPKEVSMLVKVLVTLEGSARLLNPNFSLMEIMRPYQRVLMIKRLSPTRQFRKFRRFYLQLEQLADQTPQRVSNILEQIQKGKFDVHLDHRRLGPTVNRLVLGLMTSALFLGSSFLLSYKVPPLLFPNLNPEATGINNLSILGLTGCIVSIMLGVRLLWAIRKSGNLDQKE